eukprot:856578-Pleurochrysis_carterae.AAC.1
MNVHGSVLERFVKSKQYIGQLELLAAVAAYRTFARELRCGGGKWCTGSTTPARWQRSSKDTQAGRTQLS